MNVRAKIDDLQVENMELTISFTMPVKYWRELMRQQSSAYPAWQLSSHIAKALGHLSRATDATFTAPSPGE